MSVLLQEPAAEPRIGLSSSSDKRGICGDCTSVQALARAFPLPPARGADGGGGFAPSALHEGASNMHKWRSCTQYVQYVMRLADDPYDVHTRRLLLSKTERLGRPCTQLR